MVRRQHDQHARRRPLVHCRRALQGPSASGTPHWIEAAFNDNRAVWQHLMADDVWRIDDQMALLANQIGDADVLAECIAAARVLPV